VADRQNRPRAIYFDLFRLLPIKRLLLKADEPLRLGSRALDILIAFVERPGDLIGKGELMARIWPDTFVEEGNLKVISPRSTHRFVARISIHFHLRRTYFGRPSSSMRFSEATAMTTSVVCRPSVREQRVTDDALVAADIRLHQGTPIVTRCPLPAHAASLGDQLQMPVARCRRGLCRSAWHRARTGRHNDRHIRMTLAVLTVDIVPIVRSIAGKRRNRFAICPSKGSTCEPSSTSLLVSSAAMICPVSASTPI
jgi:hypothetical protein